jgi:hypothetical protein
MDISDNEQEGDQNDQMEGEQTVFEDDSVQGFFNHKGI